MIGESDSGPVRFSEDGRQIERWFHLLDQDGFDAFFDRFG